MVRASDQGSRHVQVGGNSSADIDHTLGITVYIPCGLGKPCDPQRGPGAGGYLALEFCKGLTLRNEPSSYSHL